MVKIVEKEGRWELLKICAYVIVEFGA